VYAIIKRYRRSVSTLELWGDHAEALVIAEEWRAVHGARIEVVWAWWL
jgi:hypothetical protein